MASDDRPGNKPPDTALTLSALRAELAQCGDKLFRLRYDTPMLVSRKGLGVKPASFVTQFAAPASMLVDAERGDPEVFIVQKRPGSPYEDRIGVGRAPNVDVSIRREGISKYHAFFVPVAREKYQLADAGSKNGTFIEELRLANREPVPLQDGNLVRFGTESFVFLLSDAMIELLSS